MKFCIENINNWIDVRISGFPRFIIAFDNIIPEDYIDKSTILIFLDFKEKILDQYDYGIVRDLVKEIVELEGGFNNLAIAEKYHALTFTKNIDGETLGIPFLISEGFSILEATDEYLRLRSIDVRNATNCFTNRLNKPALTKTIIKHLGQGKGEVFFTQISRYVHNIKETAMLGINYGGTLVGFMNYIENTEETIHENAGLKELFNLPEEQNDYEGCKKEIKDLIWIGYES